jgi:hypothetical protein
MLMMQALEENCNWWDKLTGEGQDFGYFANPSKSWLVVKEEKLVEARSIFEGSGISKTVEDHSYLGAAVGVQSSL